MPPGRAAVRLLGGLERRLRAVRVATAPAARPSGLLAATDGG